MQGCPGPGRGSGQKYQLPLPLDLYNSHIESIQLACCSLTLHDGGGSPDSMNLSRSLEMGSKQSLKRTLVETGYEKQGQSCGFPHIGKHCMVQFRLLICFTKDALATLGNNTVQCNEWQYLMFSIGLGSISRHDPLEKSPKTSRAGGPPKRQPAKLSPAPFSPEQTDSWYKDGNRFTQTPSLALTSLDDYL